MACGCGGNKGGNGRINPVGVRPPIVPPVALGAAVIPPGAVPNNQDRIRIERLKRDAIRQSLNLG